MKLVLKTLKQQIHEIEIEDDSGTVQDLKLLVQAKYNIEADTIKLVFNGNVLKNETTLKSNSIGDGNTIVMIVSKAKVQNKPEEPKIEAQPSKPQPQEKIEIKPSSSSNNPKPNAQSSSSNDTANKPLTQPKDYTNEIKTLSEMGFPKEYAESAIKAAKGNVNIAIEFLYNGIPDVPINDNAISGDEGEEQGETGDSTSSVEVVKRIGSIVKILCLNDPSQLQNIILELARVQPELLELIKQHESEFKERINQPPNEEDYQIFQQFSAQQGESQGLLSGASSQSSGRQDVIRLSKDEFDAVQRLKEFGFTEMEAAQAYFACDKNEELALNFLFEMKNQESNCKCKPNNI